LLQNLWINVAPNDDLHFECFLLNAVLCVRYEGKYIQKNETKEFLCDTLVTGRFLRITVEPNLLQYPLRMCEVEVFGKFYNEINQYW